MKLCIVRSFSAVGLLGVLSWGMIRAEGATWTNASGALVHSPDQPHRFSACQKLNPIWWFGNADEPIPPDWYRPGQRFRTFLWYCRNPFHNFDCYVIGVSDKTFTRTGRFPDDTFHPNGGWNWAVTRYRCLRLPFVSYSRGRVRAYAGWRAGGAFGLELKLASRQPKQQAIKQMKPGQNRATRAECSARAAP